MGVNAAGDTIGDYNAVSRIAGLGKPSNQTVSRGIGAEGWGIRGQGRGPRAEGRGFPP